MQLPRVLFAIGGLAAGGSETQLVKLLQRIHNRHVDATLVVWSPDQGSPLRAALAEVGVPIMAVGASRAPRGVRPLIGAERLRRIFRSIRPQLAYPWLEEAAVLTVPIARSFGVPTVVGRRNISGARVERFVAVRTIIRATERAADLVTVNSHAAEQAAIGRGIRSDRIRLVRNGHEALPALPLPAGEVRLGYVARFRPEKGHARLIAALSQLRAVDGWSIDMAGDGPLQEETHRCFREAGLEQRAHFLGPVTDIRAFWRTRSVAVLLSDYEGSPNALIEAAFAGRPIVATAVGGIPEVVNPDGGLLVDTRDPAGTAQALRRLIDDRELRERLGTGAREQAGARFGMDTFVEGHLAVISEALQGARTTVAP